MELPESIGPYRVLGLLGEGGSGRVYRAEEPSPKREVALKVLRNSQVASSFQARFQREIALMGALEHPGIARLYAAGTASTPSGPLPYLAMEYVRGTDLLTYCQQQALPLAAKLRLLAAVAEAVHYAHTRGIIHRDLKPGNVLVDASGTSKVLDFGIAHVSSEGDATQVTRIGEVLGTLPYMSWQQLAGEPGALDPRADVFALGVIAYQLLSGQLPFAGGRNTTLMQALKERQKKTPTPLARLLPAARGDLDTIVMKAMAHEPAARYGSAVEFAADLQRYLDRRPIEARPPTTRYLFSLFVRRHKVLTTAVVFSVLAVLAGAALAVFYGVSESRARADAEQRASETAAVNRFLNDMLVSADPAHARGRALTIIETLEPARRQLQADHTLSAAARAALATTLANTYVALGDVTTGIGIAQQARLTSEAELGVGSAAATRLRLAQAAGMQASGQLQEANQLLEPLLALRPTQGEDPRPRLKARAAYSNGLLYMGKQAESLRQIERALEEGKALLPTGDPLLLEIRQGYVSLLFNNGAYDKSIAGFVQLIADETASLGSDHPLTLLTRMDYAERLRQLGRYEQALETIRPVIAERERVSGPQHYWTLLARYVLCNTLDQAGRAAEATALIGPVVDGLRKSLGDSSADTLIAMAAQANIARNLKQYSEAERHYREIIALREKADAAHHAEAFYPVNGLALTMIETGRVEQAMTLWRELLPKADGKSDKNLVYGRLLGSYGYGLMAQNSWREAVQALEKSRAILVSSVGVQHPYTQAVDANLGKARRQLVSRQ